MKPLPMVALALALLQPVERLDATVQRAVQSRRTPALDRVMQAATDLGRRDVVAAGLLGVAVLDPVAGPPTARLALVAMAGTNLVVEGLKLAVNRPRPDAERRRADSSFPSGHAASAFSLAWILARRWRRAGLLLWPLAGAVAWSRVYLDRHFLSDVIVGGGIGLACTWAVLRLRLPWLTAAPGERAPDPAGAPPRGS